MEFGRTKERIVVLQRKYLLNLLQETGMLSCYSVETPVDLVGKIYEDDENRPIDRNRCQRLVESCYVNNPTEKHIKTVYKILQHLKKIPRIGFHFKKSSSKEIEIFTDADWVGSLTDLRSTARYCS